MSGGFRSRSAKAGSKPAPKKPHQRHDGKRPQDTPNFPDPARGLALQAIMKVMLEDAYGNLVLPQLMKTAELDRRSRSFVTEITYGTLRQVGIIDQILACCSSRPLAEIDPVVLCALRLGAYQVLFTEVTDYAAVDSTVKLVVASGREQARGFTNGMMRTITRKSLAEWLNKISPAADELGQVANAAGHPDWIAKLYAERLQVEPGAPVLAAALQANSERPQVHLVAYPGELTNEELAVSCAGEEGKYSPYCVYLPGGAPGEVLALKEGLAAVQDEGSQLIARAVVEAPVTGEDQGKWVDLCAGPGGKAALIAHLAQIQGAQLTAVEVTPHRAELIKKLVRNVPVTVEVADGRTFGQAESVDRVLVDAPCSGLGALRRRPEARWRKKPSDIPALVELQQQLLANAIRITRPGGIIVYSTCSPVYAETRGIVEQALAHEPVVELDAWQFACGLQPVGPAEKSVQMWTHAHGTDAMFFAVLQKTTN